MTASTPDMSTDHTGRATGASQIDLPPGPRLPRVLQTAGFLFGGARFLEACRRRYGGVVRFSTLFDSTFVMVFDPAMIKEVFQGSGRQLHAGEANELLGPVLGQRSVLLLDEDEHMRHRKLMLPQFHGARMHAYAEVMREAADVEIDSWPVDEPFALHPSMQSLTLRVIIRTVFGYQPGAAADDLARRLRAMVTPVARQRGLLVLTLMARLGRSDRATTSFEAARRDVDEILFDEIARRREAPDLEERTDVFSALLLAQDEDGQRLSDQEVRDELVTLLLAGHETTATGLAWTFDLLLHNRDALKRAAQGGDEYLDAVIKESLRVRPVIPAVGRVVRREPFRLNGYVIPEGYEINPSIRVVHRRADLYPQPGSFRPERFLGPGAPDTYTWVPFGGGVRRCLGASFAQMEMRVVVARVLERAQLRAASPELEEGAFRGVTIAPRKGVQVVQERAPSAGQVGPRGAE
jgi:cytochrome P450 family 135